MTVNGLIQPGRPKAGAETAMTETNHRRSHVVTDTYDVVVIGGGAAGVAAAVGAARAGARTALIERYGFLGGAATNSQVLSFCGFFVRDPDATQAEPAVGGVGREVLDRLVRLGTHPQPTKTRLGNWVVFFQPESLKLALDEVLAEAGVTVLLHSLLVGAHRVGNRITSVDIADHDGVHRLEAAAFVDASGEGDLCACAEVPMIGAAALGTSLQAASFPARIGGIEPDVVPDPGRLADLVAALADPASPAVLRPDGGTFYSLPGTHDRWWMGLDAVTDGISAKSLTTAEQACRATAARFVAALRALPGCSGALLVSTGPQLGIRESRRPAARHILGGEEAREGRAVPTGIARAAWPIEVHAAPGRPSMIPIGGPGWFHVPLAALHAFGLDNLWLGGRIIGCDAEAHGSVRVMGTAFATGQAAGVAAAHRAAGAVDVDRVRATLIGQGAIL
jgi:hypothetical protein